MELRKRTELQEVEERKNFHIETLMKKHEKAFSDMKGYYNDITLNNLALINTLRVLSQSFLPAVHLKRRYTNVSLQYNDTYSFMYLLT